MTDDEGSAQLESSASTLVAQLRACRGALRHLGDTEHQQHREFAGRVSLLAMYLDMALQAAAAAAFPPAFAVLRSALEHRVFDRLLFLASVHEDVIENVSEEMWNRWQSDPPAHLHRWERLPGNKVHVVWKGVRVLNEDNSVAYMMSIYWRWWKEYDPFVTPGRSFDDVAAGHPVDKARNAEYAKTQQQLWDEALSWKNLKTNLRLNDLATPREIAQLDVHHRFLSAFVHPFSENLTDAVYHPVYHGEWPIEDHYAHELVLLYGCWLAVDELRDFALMTQREPRVDLAGWDEVELATQLVEAQIAHFWAPGRPPFLYDRVHEGNQRVFDAQHAQYLAGQPVTAGAVADPRAPTDDRIRYHPNPLERLRRLHASSREAFSGLTWQSPWPRRDAR